MVWIAGLKAWIGPIEDYLYAPYSFSQLDWSAKTIRRFGVEGLQCR